MITFTVTNKHRPKATIVMLVSLYGKQYKKSIGIGVPVKYWNDSKKRARTTADFKEGNEINDEIDRWGRNREKNGEIFHRLTDFPCCERICR